MQSNHYGYKNIRQKHRHPARPPPGPTYVHPLVEWLGMATFFDDLGESLSNKYPEILRVLEANEEDSLERFRWSLKESKLIPRFCDSSPKTILNSIVPGCIKCHKGEEEEACLNFLSSLRKASPDLVSTAISLREEWHRLAAVVHGYPCHFLKEETCEWPIVIGFVCHV